jgi:hypothetical protein
MHETYVGYVLHFTELDQVFFPAVFPTPKKVTFVGITETTVM